MRHLLLSLAAVAALAVTPDIADARPIRRARAFYPAYVAPYYGGYYSGYRSPYYGGYSGRYYSPYYGYSSGYYSPYYGGYGSGVTIGSPGFSISIGGSPYYGGYYPGYYGGGWRYWR